MKHQCANCGGNPLIDNQIILERVNEKGIDPVWLCHGCLMYLVDLDDSEEIPVVVYVHASDCPNWCDFSCNGKRGDALPKVIQASLIRDFRNRTAASKSPKQ